MIQLTNQQTIKVTRNQQDILAKTRERRHFITDSEVKENGKNDSYQIYRNPRGGGDMNEIPDGF